MFQRGITLIELAISLAVLAVVLATAVPGISDWIDNTRIRAAAQSLKDGIETARNEAVRRNENVSFWLVSSPDNSCAVSGSSMHWVVSIDSPVGKCGAAPSPTAAPRIVMGRNAGSDASKLFVTALQSDGASVGTTVTFNGFGRPLPGAAGQIGRIDLTGKLSDTRYRALRIAVSDGGQVRICDPQVADTSDPRKC